MPNAYRPNNANRRTGPFQCDNRRLSMRNRALAFAAEATVMAVIFSLMAYMAYGAL